MFTEIVIVVYEDIIVEEIDNNLKQNYQVGLLYPKG